MCLPLTILHVHAYIQTYIYVEVDPAQCPRSSCLLNTIVGGCRYRSVKILYRCSATRKGRCNAVIVGMNRTLTRCIAHGHDATKPVPESVFGINVHDIRPLFRNRVYFTRRTRTLLSIHIQGEDGGIELKIDPIVRVKWKKTFFFFFEKVRFEFMMT